MAELMAQGAGGGHHAHPSQGTAGAQDPDYDPAIVCLICKQSPMSYIVLPSCEQPHIYCYSCAEKRYTRHTSLCTHFTLGDRS
jgi:hypothetical protein